MLGLSSGVNLTSDTGWFVNLPYKNIHTLHAQLSKYLSSDVNFTPEPGPSMNFVLLRWAPSLNKHMWRPSIVREYICINLGDIVEKSMNCVK